MNNTLMGERRDSAAIGLADQFFATSEDTKSSTSSRESDRLRWYKSVRTLLNADLIVGNVQSRISDSACADRSA
jgi:hypothetical protein